VSEASIGIDQGVGQIFNIINNGRRFIWGVYQLNNSFKRYSVHSYQRDYKLFRRFISNSYITYSVNNVYLYL